VALNSGLSITLFFALIQFFDPTLREHHEDDIAHHHLNQNPIVAGLAEFSHGKHGIRKGAEHELPRESVRAGRERILGLLEEAGVAKDLTEGQITKLPKWQQVSLLSGPHVW
jgi:hypothetical protein